MHLDTHLGPMDRTLIKWQTRSIQCPRVVPSRLEQDVQPLRLPPPPLLLLQKRTERPNVLPSEDAMHALLRVP